MIADMPPILTAILTLSFVICVASMAGLGGPAGLAGGLVTVTAVAAIIIKLGAQ